MQPPYSPEAYVPSVAPPIYQSSVYRNYNLDEHKRMTEKEIRPIRTIAAIQLVVMKTQLIRRYYF